jgi:multidrug efflux pump subunit AcrA (membrane-fusion protein)
MAQAQMAQAQMAQAQMAQAQMAQAQMAQAQVAQVQVARNYSVVMRNEMMLVTCEPCEGFVWKIACGAPCQDGLITIVITKLDRNGRAVAVFVESRSSVDELALCLRRTLPPELLVC